MPQTAENGMRILAVDDEDSLLRLYQQVIESKMPDDGPYDLTLCSTGEAAVEAVSSAVKDNRPFSLAFMDINLSSEHDGVWTAAQIRKQDPDIQIVFVTGLTNIDLKETTKRVPPPDKLYFLQKPFQPAEIVQFAISLCARWNRDREYLKIKDDLEANIRRRTAEIERTNETLKNEILKRHGTERELRKKERQYRNIIENNADAMVVLNKQGVVQYMNPAAERMFDRTPEEFVGQSFGFPIISDEMSEIDILRKSGSFVVGEMRSVETEWNGAPAYITTIRDVTLRKEMENQVRKSLSDLEKTMRGTIQAMAKAVEKRDPYTSGHQAQVEKIAVRIARQMELPETFIDGLSMAAMIHDIGKIAIPAEILSKPTQLTDIEFSLIKTHSQVGYDILKNIQFPWKIAETVLQHHEKIDGSGYPGGIEKEDILLEARIISVADSLDAIASHRPYRASLGTEFAMSEILKASGTYYDPDVVSACKRLFDAGSLFDEEGTFAVQPSSPGPR